MRKLSHPHVYSFAALTLTIASIIYSAWLFGGSELFGNTFSEWRGSGYRIESNPALKFFQDSSYENRLQGARYDDSAWGGLVPYSDYFRLILVPLPILIGLTGLMWWKTVAETPKPFNIGHKFTTIIMLIAAAFACAIVVDITALWPSEGDPPPWGALHGYQRQTPGEFTPLFIMFFDWLLVMSLLSSMVNMIGLWISGWKQLGSPLTWLSTLFLIAYLGAFAISLGGTITGIVTLIIVTSVWLLALGWGLRQKI